MHKLLKTISKATRYGTPYPNAIGRPTPTWCKTLDGNKRSVWINTLAIELPLENMKQV